MKAVATLGPDEYVTEVKEKISFLFSHALLARHSDDALFKYETVSIQYHAMQHPKSPTDLAAALESALNKYFLRNFDGASMKVRSEIVGDSVKLVFSGNVSQDGTSYDFARQFLVSPTNNVKDLEEVFSFGGI